MAQVQKVSTYKEYKLEIVDKDHADFLADDGDIRKAFHSAISLFHLHDWVYAAHDSYINANFTFLLKSAPTPVSNAKQFADSLSDASPDFALIRGVANSAKHLELRTPDPKRPPPPPSAPSNAANTFSQSTGWGEGKWGEMKWGGAPTIMLEGANNNHIVLSRITSAVMTMWNDLFIKHGW
jgi:hypothetical protein